MGAGLETVKVKVKVTAQGRVEVVERKAQADF